MASGAGPADVIGRIVAALDAAGVPYMMTGSFASAIHGAPRSTQDVDVVVAPTRTSLMALVDQFPEDRYYLSREAALGAYENAGMFNVVDLQTGWKVDFILQKPRDFSRAEFDRRIETEALGTRLYVATAEDVLVAKLEWGKIGGSERQIRDAAGIIATQGEDLDVSYVETWVAKLELQVQWDRARTLAP